MPQRQKTKGKTSLGPIIFGFVLYSAETKLGCCSREERMRGEEERSGIRNSRRKKTMIIDSTFWLSDELNYSL